VKNTIQLKKKSFRKKGPDNGLRAYNRLMGRASLRGIVANTVLKYNIIHTATKINILDSKWEVP